MIGLRVNRRPKEKSNWPYSSAAAAAAVDAADGGGDGGGVKERRLDQWEAPPQRTVITVKSTTSTRTKTTISISTSKEWKAAAAVALHRQAAAVLYSIRPPKSRNATSRQPKIIITSSTVRLNRKLRSEKKVTKKIDIWLKTSQVKNHWKKE